MSPQLVEFLILGVIAIVIIAKLISILGVTDADEKNIHSAFGSKNGTKIKSVYGITEDLDSKPSFSNSEWSETLDKIPDFNEVKFVNGATKVFHLVVTALQTKDLNSIEELVDKRFFASLENIMLNYDSIDISNVKLAIEDVYSFGNSVYIRTKISGIKAEEFWIFTKNINDTSKNWDLSNIEKLN
jgi:predicted lipid-binding transport protein (Tim44 family)